MMDTFTMANICPQSKQMNMGIWQQFETWIRREVISPHNSYSNSYGNSNSNSNSNGNSNGSTHNNHNHPYDIRHSEVKGTETETIVITGPAYLPIQMQGEFIYMNKTIGNSVYALCTLCLIE